MKFCDGPGENENAKELMEAFPCWNYRISHLPRKGKKFCAA